MGFLRNGSEEEARTEKRVRTKRRTDSSIWDFGIRVRERERDVKEKQRGERL